MQIRAGTSMFALQSALFHNIELSHWFCALPSALTPITCPKLRHPRRAQSLQLARGGRASTSGARLGTGSRASTWPVRCRRRVMRQWCTIFLATWWIPCASGSEPEAQPSGSATPNPPYSLTISAHSGSAVPDEEGATLRAREGGIDGRWCCSLRGSVTLGARLGGPVGVCGHGLVSGSLVWRAGLVWRPGAGRRAGAGWRAMVAS